MMAFYKMENDCNITVEFDRYFVLIFVMAMSFQNNFVFTNPKCHQIKSEINLPSALKDVSLRLYAK